MNLRDQMERIYREVPIEEIPWNLEQLPDALIRLINSGAVRPCRAIDLGCGAGNYAIALAVRGFDVTGVDISPRAVELARSRAKAAGVTCRFVAADLLGDLKAIPDTFDFAYDWELLHHIFPEQRATYVRNVHRLLRPGAKYLSACFHEDDPAFGGKGKFRTTSLGTVLYFSAENELRSLFSRWFGILELRKIEVSGKHGPHAVNLALLEKVADG